MTLANLKADNALMFGSDDDSFYLGNYGTDLTSITGLDSTLPTDLVDLGWISDDGIDENLDDSSDSIKGHQGNRKVKSFISDSSTSIEVTALETKLQTFLWYYDATVEKQGAIAKITIPPSRQSIDLVGVSDLFDTSLHFRQRRIYSHLTLTTRDAVSYKVGDITMYKFTLDVIDDAVMYTDQPSMIPSGS